MYYPVINWEPTITIFVIFSWSVDCSTTRVNNLIVKQTTMAIIILVIFGKTVNYQRFATLEPGVRFHFPKWQSESKNTRKYYAIPCTMNCHQYNKIPFNTIDNHLGNTGVYLKLQSRVKIQSTAMKNYFVLFFPLRAQVHLRGSAPHHPSPSSPWPPSLGFRLFISAAFPLTRAIESCWKRWRVVVISSSPVCRARALPSFLISEIADLCQAPRLSTASGRKTIPCWSQACQD